MSVIEIKNVNWQREDRHILQHMNWTVEHGEHWAIIGANGAGKTALLNIISGYMWPSSGSVKILGKKFGHYDLRELRKSIGWVSSALFERFNRFRPNEPTLEVVLSGKFASIGVYETIKESDRREADELLGFFGCAHLARQPFNLLSQGEKQRILLARAWMTKPELLILDEPCTGLDLLARESLLESVRLLAEAPDGPTILYVTHHVEEITPLFTHALLLKDGQMLARGEKKKTLTDDHLSEVFGVPINLVWQEGRPWVRLSVKEKQEV